MRKRSKIFLYNEITKENGSSLFETLVTVTLCSLLFLLIAENILGLLKLNTKLQTAYKTLETKALIQSELTKIIQNYDKHPLPYGLVIHKNGNVKLYDGLPHAISRINSTSRPRNNSDVISSVEMNFKDAYYLKRSGARLQMCSLFNNKPNETPTSYFGLTTHEFYHAIISAERSSLSGCRNITIKLLKSIFAPEIDISLVPLTTILIPVYSEYSLYVDASGQLRYVGHVGNIIKENQPILRGLRTITLKQNNSGIPGFETIQLMASIRLIHDETFSVENQSQLARRLPIEASLLRIR